MRAAAAALGENGAVFYPVLSAAYKLLKEAGRASVYLEGQENLLNYPEAERSFRTLLEFFADDAAVKRCISPKTERTTVLLGDDLPEYAMPGQMCIRDSSMSTRTSPMPLAVAVCTRTPRGTSPFCGGYSSAAISV